MMAQGLTVQKNRLFNESLARKGAAPARKVANERFAELLNEAADRHPLFSYDQIFNRVARENPELLGTTPKGNEFTNDAAPSAASPVAGPQNNALLMLPATTNQRVFDACFRANGNKFAPLKHGDVFNATVNERAAETGQPYATALAWCKTTYAQLWRMVEEAAKF